MLLGSNDIGALELVVRSDLYLWTPPGVVRTCPASLSGSPPGLPTSLTTVIYCSASEGQLNYLNPVEKGSGKWTVK